MWENIEKDKEVAKGCFYIIEKKKKKTHLICFILYFGEFGVRKR